MANRNNSDHGSMDHGNMQSTPHSASVFFDLQFIDNMIVHHQEAIDTAKVTQIKASHAELLAMAKDIVSSQSTEIEQLKKWRREWFSDAPPAKGNESSTSSHSMKPMNTAALDKLQGNAYDIEFITQMIPHHEGAVMMAKDALQQSTKPEIRKMATEIIKAQEAEIRLMQGWQAAWTKK
jgi:uncharacterized protein (DUF305 family)